MNQASALMAYGSATSRFSFIAPLPDILIPYLNTDFLGRRVRDRGVTLDSTAWPGVFRHDYCFAVR